MSELRLACGRPSDVEPQAWPVLQSLLDDEEQTRAARFRFDADRQAYVLAHALRRRMLARELETLAPQLRFIDDSEGRPQLIHPDGQGLFFSHSHCREAVACVVTRIAPVGVDVEAIHEERASAALLERFMSAPLPDPSDHDAEHFFIYWTAIEAFWKAQGVGLADRNARIHVAPRRDEWSAVHLPANPTHAAGHVMSLAMPAGCVLTLALTHMDEKPRLIFEACNSGMEINQLFKERALP